VWEDDEEGHADLRGPQRHLGHELPAAGDRRGPGLADRRRAGPRRRRVAADGAAPRRHPRRLRPLPRPRGRRLGLRRRAPPVAGQRLHGGGARGAAAHARPRELTGRAVARAPARGGPVRARPPERRRRVRVVRAAPRQHDPPAVQPGGDLRQLHARVLVQRVHRELHPRPRGRPRRRRRASSAASCGPRSTRASSAAPRPCCRSSTRTGRGPGSGASTSRTGRSSRSTGCSPPACRRTTRRSPARSSGCSPPSAPTAGGPRASRATSTTATSSCPPASRARSPRRRGPPSR
jgi:hypothetical protein